MKKILRNILILCMVSIVFSSCVVMASYDTSLIEKLGIIPEGVSDSQIVTRELFAYSMAHAIAPQVEFTSSETAFLDVTSENRYIGEIAYVAQRNLMAGSGNGLFMPEEYITYEQISKVLVSASGYSPVAEKNGGYPDGYVNTAMELSLFDGIADLNSITVADLKCIFANLFGVGIPDNKMYLVDGNLTENIDVNNNNQTFAKKYLSLYEYEGIVKSVDTSEYIMQVNITKDKSGKYSYNQEVLFTASANIEIKSFENAPVIIVADEDDNIIDIRLRKNVEVRYAVVENVNNSNENKQYYTSYLSSIKFKGDEEDYDVASGVKVMHNDKVCQDKIYLVDKYVKVIIVDDEIACIETWDLSEGGIISKIDYNNIYYISGNSEYRMTEIMKYTRTYVIIDGESRNINELKPGMLMYYYKDISKNSLVLVASSKKLTDVLKSMNTSSKELQIGGVYKGYSDTFYLMKDGIYQKNTSALMLSFYNTEVDALVDIYDNVKYIAPANETISDTVLGYLVGIQSSALDEITVRIVDIEKDGVFEEHKLSEKVQYEEGLTKQSFEAVAGAMDGSELFEFRINSLGEITRIKEPYKFDGFETAKTTPTRFVEDSTKIYMNVDGRRLYFDDDTKIIGVSCEEGKYSISNFVFSDLKGYYCSGITMRFYGFEGESDVRFATITGDIKSISSMLKFGVMTDVHKVLKENGETCYSASINGNEVFITEENANAFNICDNMYVGYRNKVYEDGFVLIEEAIDLSDDFSNWEGRSSATITLIRGTVDKADSKRIMLSDGTDYFYRQGEFTFYNLGNTFKVFDYRDILPGTEVILAVGNQEIYTTFTNEIR